ncbi:hypothetical protein GCM10022276_26770 [Sphingomonas limnosediminicola]|jgi:hypothetical protein|uniref:Uncharacterized protein n=1 Tax=Sphingomonas limnosediminicola TaxID=940133 RepID=A0ABP7LR12_9SPHN
MHKLLALLAILGSASVPAAAQTAPATAAPATQQAEPAKPQMVKKRVCEQVDEDSYSRLGNRKICKTVMVPADQAGDSEKTSSSSERGN